MTQNKDIDIDLDLYEILDRSHCLQCRFDDDILEHQALEKYPDLRKAASEAAKALMNLYQMANRIDAGKRIK